MRKLVDPYYDLNKGLKRKSAYINLPCQLKASSELIDKHYNHITFTVHSVSDYMDVIRVIKSSNTFKPTYVFRGMSDYKFKLVPSLARGDLVLQDNAEYCMAREMVTLRPEEFASITSSFDLLAKMQHFGIPTRLLDFSLNPLVALYFACSDHVKKIGSVVCTAYSETTDSSDLIEAFCNLHKYPDVTSVMADDIFSTREMLWKYKTQSRFPILKKPPYFDNRIKHQSAVFMIFPNQLYDRIGRAAYLENIISDKNNINYGFEPTSSDRKIIDYVKEHEPFEKIYPRIQINLKVKDLKIHQEMLDFEVTPESLSAQFHIYQDKKIVDWHGVPTLENEVDPFKRRFSVENCIQPISDFSIENYFCSILIEPKYKKSILNELDVIGINEPFIYPELEYTAKYIKKKFYI